MPPNHDEQLKAAMDAILNTVHPKKIIVAGAGTGKTATFKELLRRLGQGPKDRRLVATFLGGLKKDLEKDLGDLARVYTFHGYCFSLLRSNPNVRATAGVTEAIHYAPRIGQLVKSDWRIINSGAAPDFAPHLRNALDSSEITFFLARGCYYDATGFDDSIVHVQRALANRPQDVPVYDLVIIDEFQDFNRSEVEVINALSSKNSVVIAGDDDQALYGNLRGASEQYIREFHKRPDYKSFNLPFCMRCPSVVVNATNDIIAEAHQRQLLGDRIQKRYDSFHRPVDDQYPKLRVVQTSVQNAKPKATNYFGRYILEQIKKIPHDETEESYKKGFPTVLLIGGNPYGQAVKAYLESEGWVVSTKDVADESMDDPYDRDDGLAVLKDHPSSNYGWRIVLEVDKPKGFKDWIRSSVGRQRLSELVDEPYRTKILAELETWKPAEKEEEDVQPVQPADRPSIRLTSFHGAKGMSAQHVFILGLEEGRLPSKRTAIKSLEVRKIIVALTRTRKQCHILYPRNTFKKGTHKTNRPSVFLEWVKDSRKESLVVDARYSFSGS